MARLLPACSKWKIWTGKECEGTKNFGAETLFIRKMSKKDAWLFKKHKRIWFTKEFKNKEIIKLAIADGCEICLEVDLQTIKLFPEEITKKVSLYIKLPKKVKTGDHVKFGEPFSETVLELVGEKTNSLLYFKDVKIR